MPDLSQPLATPAATTAGPPRRRVLVLGGGGPLGSKVVEALLALHRHEQVGVVVKQRVSPALRGLATIEDSDVAWRAFGADAAVIVFDRERRANGRDDAFVRPRTGELPALARRLHEAGAHDLVVTVPHAPALLPQALKRGLASMDEGAVAELGFEQLVFMRLAQTSAAPDATEASAPQRLAAWMLGQLRWMVPSAEQPVQEVTVARVTAQLVQALPGAAPGTRVLPPELLWHVAQGRDAATLLQRWLAGEALSPLRPPRQRM